MSPFWICSLPPRGWPDSSRRNLLRWRLKLAAERTQREQHQGGECQGPPQARRPPARQLPRLGLVQRAPPGERGERTERGVVLGPWQVFERVRDRNQPGGADAGDALGREFEAIRTRWNFRQSRPIKLGPTRARPTGYDLPAPREAAPVSWRRRTFPSRLPPGRPRDWEESLGPPSAPDAGQPLPAPPNAPRRPRAGIRGPRGAAERPRPG